jgi:hypothetical protein
MFMKSIERRFVGKEWLMIRFQLLIYLSNEDSSRTIRMNIYLVIGRVLCIKDSLEMEEMGID